MSKTDQLEKIATRLRIHSLKMTTHAGSGHPTTCMSMAETMACLFFDEMQYDVKNPFGYNNDEFVLSKGHAAPILWASYAEAGIINEKDLMNLRKIGSVLEGHPTPRMPWVKAATGSLGQGLSVGVGLALGIRLDRSGQRVYVLMGDGECASGNVWEAANTAAYYRLNNLCTIVDVNRLGQSQETMHGHKVDIYQKKFKAFGWDAQVVDGHSVSQILRALRVARKSKRPTAIIAKTFKGHGVSFVEDKNGWHGRPLKPDQLEKALAEIGPMPKVDAKKLVRRPSYRGRSKGSQCHCEEARRKPGRRGNPAFPMSKIEYSKGQMVATREAFGHALLGLGGLNRAVVAIDGDVKNSTNTEAFFKKYPEHSFESFIAEQNMVGMAIGLSARGYLPFAATFACFLERAHDQIRMAAYSFSNIKLVGSHVGVSIGADGPSQMALEDIAMFRPIPNCLIFYPSDAYSTVACTQLMAGHKGIAYLRTSRPKTPIIYNKNDRFRIGGSKVLKKSKKDRVTVIAAGITLHNALEAYEVLKGQGIYIRVIDAYSVKPLDKAGIIKNIRETKGKVIVVEDHFEAGGLGEAVKSTKDTYEVSLVHLCVRDLPRSGKPDELMNRYKIDSKGIIAAVKKLI